MELGLMEAAYETGFDDEEFSDESDAELASLEADIFNYYWDTIIQARARAQNRHRQWRGYWRRYRGRHVEVDDNTPLADLNPPKLARIVDSAVARTMQLNIPNLDRCDIMRLDPYMEAEDEIPYEELVRYAAYAETALQHDLVKGEFPTHYRRALLDLFVTGNCVMLPEWGMERQWRYKRHDNPLYDPTLPPEANVTLGPDGTWRRIPQYEYKLTPYFEFDAPRVRHINMMNVYPSEMDRNNLSECSAVAFYDTVRRTELLDEEIAEGGYLYANMDLVTPEMENPTVSEVHYYGGEREADIDGSPGLSRSSSKLERWSVIGRFVLEEITMGRKVSPKTIEKFHRKYRIDPEKGIGSGWKTWIIEIVNEGQVMVRCQPIPYVNDRMPFHHFGLYAKPNVTLAEGFYDRGAAEEIIHNALQRYRLELTLKMVRPMYGMIREFFAKDQAQLKDGRLNYTPGGIIYMNAGKSINEGLQALSHNPTALTATDSAMDKQERTMAELTQQPNVKTGVASGGATATENMMLGQAADLISEFLGERIEAEFLRKVLGDLLLLHHQFTEEEKIVPVRDEAGRARCEVIPPEVWMKNYAVEMTAYRRTGNQMARVMSLKDYASTLMQMGVANKKAIAIEIGKAMQIRDAEKMYQEPPQAPFGIDMKAAMSMAMRQELTPPSVMADFFSGWFGRELTPQQVAEMGLLYEAFRRAEDERQKAATAAGQEVEPIAKPPNVGGEMNPGPKRSHHAPGEETPTRALPDDQGTAQAVQQRLREPTVSNRLVG